MINLQKRIGEIAAEVPGSLSLFESLHIDYCCHGERTLEQVCKEIGLTPSELLALIDQTECRVEQDSRDWSREPLRELIFHIVGKHHAYTRSELVRLAQLWNKVIGAHRENHCELIQLGGLLELLREELRPHMMKEEQILFPFVAMLEDAVLRRRPMPVPPFDTVESPIRVLMNEHEAAATLLQQMRAVTLDFHVPLDGCASYRALMNGLMEFERNLHRHIHLENNILFPRAVQLESTGGSSVQYDYAGLGVCDEC